MKNSMTLAQHVTARLYLPGKTFLLLTFLFAVSLTHAYAETPVEQIIDVAHDFLEQQAQDYLEQSKISGRYQIEISRIDNRLRMPICSTALQASLESPAQPLGRVTVRIRCTGQAPWSIFVPGQVSLYRNVVVSTRPLKRNTVLQDTDITLAERDIGTLKQGYLVHLDEALGNLLTRATQADQPLSPNQLRAPAVIKRGDQVIIIAVSGNVHVRMSGEALSDGGIGEQIRVRNTRSQQIIFARVTGPGQVEVAM